MGKRVLIISSSPRKNGNSDTLCHSFARGAKEKGNEVIEIFTNDKKINYCKACGYCETHNGACSQKDDMAEIIDEVLKSDVIVFSSPVYFYSISGQLKTLIDRTVARYTEIKNKEFYIIATAAENAKHTFDRTLESVRGFIDCIDGAKEKAFLSVGGVWKKGDINHTDTLKKAYSMGAAV